MFNYGQIWLKFLPPLVATLLSELLMYRQGALRLERGYGFQLKEKQCS
jgi:hypothetical protein